MLMIDDNMLRLAKMHETLLKVDALNRDKNLRKYKEIVIEIDSKAFESFLEEIKHIEEHNHTFESELKFLEKIVDLYNQLNELQLSFMDVCRVYGNDNLSLSDLSQINIDYINSRMNVISGYLINIKNIDGNKKEIQLLSEQLIEEEKKKIFLDSKLLEMEELLKNNFLNAEGRLIVSGNLHYTSVLDEYSKLGFDVNELLNDSNLLKDILSDYDKKRSEISESVKAAEVCYHSLLTVESKQVLNEIQKEELLIKYKLTMLKILKVLSQTFTEYDDFVSKREQLLDLIKYRLNCTSSLGIKFSIDPFDRIKINDQLELVLSFKNNSKVISKIMKEISELNSKTEKMEHNNSTYLDDLNKVGSLLENRMSFSDIDVDDVVEFDFEDIIRGRQFAMNQIVNVRSVSDKLNMHVVKQKTSGVIRRVNQMMNNEFIYQDNKTEISMVPELVIVPKKTVIVEQEDLCFDEALFDEESYVSVEEHSEPVSVIIHENESTDGSMELVDVNNINNDMFETIIPFDEPTFFVDRLDEGENKNSNVISDDGSLTSEELFDIANKEEKIFELQYDKVDNNSNNGINNFDDIGKLPDAFWVVQEETTSPEGEVIPSFDDQIDKLLAVDNDNNDIKIRRKVA